MDHREPVDLIFHAGLFEDFAFHRFLGGLAVMDGAADRVEIILSFVACKKHTALFDDDRGRAVTEPPVLVSVSKIVFHSYSFMRSITA